MSAIQECIVELESDLESQESQGKSQGKSTLLWCNLFQPVSLTTVTVTAGDNRVKSRQCRIGQFF